jgi:type IV secretion/conjugal transfer VirB4 family ATPase
MLNIAKMLKPWKESGALNAHVGLYCFWSEHTALTKAGQLSLALRVKGVDYESLDSAEQQYAIRRKEAALKNFDEGFRVYEYLFKTNRPEIPFASYGDDIVDTAVDHRRRYFESKRDRMYRIEIFYVIVLEGQRSQTGILAALKRLPKDFQGGLRELKAQFAGDKMKVYLRKQIDADQQRLESRVQNFVHQLSDFVQIDVLGQQEQFSFYRRLLNFDDWRIAGTPKSTQFLDYQVVNSDIEAERDHLRIGDHYVRLMTMKESIAETRPMVLDQLLKIDANFHVVLEWTPLSTAKARKEITMRRRHFNVAKTSFFSQMRDEKKLERDQLIDESKQADVEQLGQCLRALGDGQTMGDLSLTIVINSTDLDTINRQMGQFAGIFTNADGSLFAETYNQLNALFATIPGNHVHNLRRMYMLLSNYADLSFLFTIHPGELTNPHLGTEYLAVLETDNSTPYFLNLHNGEVAHTLISGMTGGGKSFFAAFLVTCLQKYRPFTCIFDIGGSFQSVTEIFGGSYLNVGQESRDFTINPFSLEPTKENLQFLASFFRVLIEGNDERHRLDYKEERKLWDAIERMYTVPPEQRTVSTFATIVGDLKDRMHRWTRDGQYGFLFDNVEDTLTFSHFQTFNFAGWGDSPEALDPLLFYVLHRAANRIADPENLATFKAFLMDEAWLFIKNSTIRDYVISAQKTWRKHNAAMILATQSIAELESSGMLEIVAESCPTKIFLANPEMNRETYGKAFHLNDTELDLIVGLIPPSEMLIRKAQSSKKVRLEVDSVSYWIATNNARDNLKKRDYFARYGIAEGIRHLALDFPFQSSRPAPTPSSPSTSTYRPPALALATR